MPTAMPAATLITMPTMPAATPAMLTAMTTAKPTIPTAKPAVIEVAHLTKRYKYAKTPSVDDISFSVLPGEFFAFLGPNGAGKTTTISILTTTLNKTSGEVRIAGYDVQKQAREVREKVGIIFQRPSLDPQLTAEQNIRFHACLYGMCDYHPSFKLMPAAYRKRVLDLAEIVGISDALFKPIKKLSGGMQRKLEIIRSLIHTPDVLFLDEPTQGLDAVSRRGLWDYLNEVRLQHGTTIFLTTHYIDEAENVDKVCIINHGQIAACASPGQLKQRLLKQELIIDASNRTALASELDAMGLSYKVNGQIVVPYQGSAQKIISALKSPLTVLRINEPTLEDAYVQFLRDADTRDSLGAGSGAGDGAGAGVSASAGVSAGAAEPWQAGDSAAINGDSGAE